MEANNQAVEMTTPLLDVDQTPIPENQVESENANLSESSLWMLMGGLLLLQFGTTYYCLDNPCVSMPVIGITIALFVMTGWLYHQARHEVNMKWTSVLLLPEILVNVVLFLVLFDRPDLGVTVLLWGAISLSCVVVSATVPPLFCGGKQDQEEDEEEESSELTECRIV